MNRSKADDDAAEFFVRAMYHWFFGLESLAEDYFYVAAMTLNVNVMYQREILNKMN